MSSISFAQRLAGASKVLAIFVVVALFAAVVLVFNRGSDGRTITADFTQTTSLYVGSEVRVLGVPVGKVTKLQPKGEFIRATIEYDRDVKLPEDVKAVIVSPAIVGDRFVQLAPAYSGGQVLADDAHLNQDSTAVPVELDQVYSSIDDLAVALGPDGANADGALSDLVSSTAAQLDGQGAQLNETLKNFGQFTTTLSDNSDELFAGVRQVEDFVSMLEANDATVRSFNDNTAAVAEVLEGERDDLAATLATLSTALTSVESLVSDNRSSLRTNVTNLKSLAEVLAARESELGQFAVTAPTVLSNVTLAYNPVYGTLDTHANLPSSILNLLTGPGGPARLICSVLGQAPETPGSLCKSVFDLLAPIFGGLPALPSPGGETGLPVDPTAAAPDAPATTAPDLASLVQSLTGAPQ
ncbi:MCE family protein [Aeromicrobium alkaliterrae]|uniref:MCE family protein n=1 Tax=Aeromicrobium alkaliterrae TaxID=302168 RepID=A0ABN2KDS4_9ACTN